MRFVRRLLLVGSVERPRTQDSTRAIVISDPPQDPRIRTSPVYDGVSVAVGRNVPVRSGGLAPVRPARDIEQSRPITALPGAYSYRSPLVCSPLQAVEQVRVCGRLPVSEAPHTAQRRTSC